MDEPVKALRATAHPLRLQMLSLLTGAELSAAEVARELGITHANASYHLRVLARAGEVVEAGEERVRGGVAKRYRHPWQQRSKGTGSAPEERPDRELEVRTMTEELLRRHALRELPGRALYCDAELWVDDEVWTEALALVERAAVLVHDRARPPRSEGARKVALTVAAFGMRP